MGTRSEHDLFIATYDVPDQPVSRKYQKSNVAFGTGQLEMTVSAYSGSGPVLSSAIVSNQYFKYGSTRVNLKATAVEGICIGHFFYGNPLFLFWSNRSLKRPPL